MRHYQAAAATIERVQRGLSITLRPGFLEDKGEALRSLIMLQLQAGRPADAFQALERAKSQVLLGYLALTVLLTWPLALHPWSATLPRSSSAKRTEC